MSKKLELLAPAGNLLKLETGLAFGAQAVYLGVPDFSLRARANNFDLSSLAEGINYAHDKGALAYVTLNIFAHEEHLDRLPEFLKKLRNLKPDALIVADPGIISMVKKDWPEAVIHLSTQANCTNSAAAQFWQAAGVKRIILAREVTLKEIKAISQAAPDLELEYFVHGAMCMAYSGRCFLSRELTGRSANLGDCVQPCRWQYQLKPVGHEKEFEVIQEPEGSYFLNSQDLCLIESLPDLMAAGVTSFKIEGRAKSVYYEAVVTGIYAQALEYCQSGLPAAELKEKLKELKQELINKLTHRGYTDGFLLGEKAGQNLECTRLDCDWEFCGQAVAAAPEYFIPETKPGEKVAYFKVHNTWLAEDRIEIVRSLYDVLKPKITVFYDALTGEPLTEAHGGGGGRQIAVVLNEAVPVLSVVRRFLKPAVKD
ncbi:MAG: peptidase U32 family protein [Candidatus Parcubacteria bacterium]|nr:MAG: U32 family peptidase [Candidatus Parcubacteria bacterium]